MHAELQRWNPSSRDIGLEIESTEQLGDLLAAIAPAWSATLELISGKGSLIVSATKHVFTATALLGDDDFYDKIGDEAGRGTVRMPVGGQPIDMPACFRLNLSEAFAAAAEFLGTGTVDVTSGWVRADATSAKLWQTGTPTP